MRRWGRGDLVILTGAPNSMWSKAESWGSVLLGIEAQGSLAVVLREDVDRAMVEIIASGGGRGWMSKSSLRRVQPAAWARGDKSSKTPDFY